MDINTCLATTSDLRSLALYANIVPALTSIILAGFVLMRAPDRTKAYLFAGFVGVFSMWLLANSLVWNSNDYYLIVGLWMPLAYLELLFFLLLFCFFWLDVFAQIPRWLGAVLVAVATVSFIPNVLGQAARGFDQAWCNVDVSEFLLTYDLWVEIVILITILGLGIYRFLKSGDSKAERVRLTIVTVSIVLFMGIFSGAEFISSNSTAYFTELYALFTLPIFILLLTVSITTYGTFRLGDTVAKLLFYIFLVFSGAEFFFVTSTASLVLTAIAFLMTLSFGILLLQSYERESYFRSQLQLANDQQVVLIHFITHQIKGFVAKSRNIFSLLLDGDFGPVPDTMRPMLEEGFKSDTKGAQTIQEILNAANIKSGRTTYTMAPFDLKALIEEVVKDLRPAADAKSLEFKLELGSEPLTVSGDRAQLVNVFKNLIDNSVKYTQKGHVFVSLTKEASVARFKIEDTGVGITQADMKNLFTEGGHGAESQKINVDSTGFGLFIVKNIVDAHKGKVWAESDGAGKGSRFTVELPL